MEFIDKVKYILFLQIITVTILVLLLTILRFFFEKEYKILCDRFVSISSYDTDISLVIEGENS